MPISITIATMQRIFPSTPKDVLISYIPHINVLCNKHFIDTPLRLSAFLSQVGHESAELTRTVENLNYSAEGLIKIFKKYFTPDQSKEYAKNPEKIANRVYANRMGNGDESSGDGWRFRGRGALQITGKNNYQAFAKWCGKSLENVENYLSTPEGIIASAVYFWTKNNLNVYADKEDTVGLTRKINGGTNGLTERKNMYEHIRNILC